MPIKTKRAVKGSQGLADYYLTPFIKNMKTLKYPIYSAKLYESELGFSQGKYCVEVLRGDLSKNPKIDKTICYYNFKTKEEAEKRLNYYLKQTHSSF